jgi:hypothetical protein
MEFLDLLETVRAEEASVTKLFGGEGQGVRSIGRKSPLYAKKLAEATRLLADVVSGKKPSYHLREALTTSDFPYLFGDIIDRMLLANYSETPQVWPMYAIRKTVSDFRTVKRFVVNGSEAVLLEVPQQTEYPESKVSDAAYSYAVKKLGRRIPFSWEAMINDDLDALKDIPARFGKAARRSEEKFGTQLHVDANGPHASVYTAGNKNIINTTNSGAGVGFGTNPALSIAALQQGFAVLANQVDTDGEPITIEAVTLEVPPALEVMARNILNAVQIWIQPNVSAGTPQQQLVAENWMKSKTSLAVNPYIPIVASSANGNTSWFLHANPNVGRPAFEMGFLRGHETPEVFIKMPNMQMVGGGVDQLMGDFETDSIIYKVRHVIGGTAEDPKMTAGSNGSGS